MLGIKPSQNFEEIKKAYDGKIHDLNLEREELIHTLQRVNYVLDECNRQLANEQLMPYSRKLQTMATGKRAHVKQCIRAEMESERQKQQEQERKVALIQHIHALNAALAPEDERAKWLEDREHARVMKRVHPARNTQTDSKLPIYKRIMGGELSVDEDAIDSIQKRIEQTKEAQTHFMNALETVLELQRGLRELYSKINTPGTFHIHLALEQSKALHHEEMSGEITPLEHTITTPSSLERVVVLPALVRRPPLDFFSSNSRQTAHQQKTKIGRAEYILPALKEPDAPLPEFPHDEEDTSQSGLELS